MVGAVALGLLLNYSLLWMHLWVKFVQAPGTASRAERRPCVGVIGGDSATATRAMSRDHRTVAESCGISKERTFGLASSHYRDRPGTFEVPHRPHYLSSTFPGALSLSRQPRVAMRIHLFQHCAIPSDHISGIAIHSHYSRTRRLAIYTAHFTPRVEYLQAGAITTLWRILD
jgi:hypothetical protein